ncbi:MAG: hypothetical protein JRH07_17460, partial [Deltaproteobacteria bacterium]|nr:hypothetical protein [Deltaproteobacteria bacterium]
IPGDAARELGADIVIGVDVGFRIHRAHVIGDGLDEIHRVTEIMSFYLGRERRESADLLIEPAVGKTGWTDFLRYEELIREGERAAESKLGEIKKVLSKGSKRGLIRWAGGILGLKRQGRRASNRQERAALVRRELRGKPSSALERQ